MRFLIPFFLFFSITSQAATYSWSYPGGEPFPSAKAVCDYFQSIYGSGWQTLTKYSETQFGCQVQGGYTNINRIGDNCPENTVYDPSTGECKADPCASKSGQSKRFQKASSSSDSYGSINSIGGKPTFIAQTAGCFDGCSVSTADQKCVARVSGAYVCRGTAYFTGQACVTGGGAPAPVLETTAQDPAPATVKTDLPCKYVSNPDGTQSCTSITAKESEGLQCGTVNGQQTCVAKDPGKDETKIDTSVKSVTNADGSVTTIKTDVQTKTKCTSYAPSCTSTSTTTTTTTTKSTTGELIASGQECSGANCSTSGNPDGDGDGFGDCTGDNCGEGEDGKPSNKPTMPKLDGAPTYAESLASFQNKIKAAPIYAAVGGLSVPSGGSCSFGSAQTFFGAISFDDFCAIAPTILNPLRYLFLAVWAWAAIRLFFTA